MDYFYFDIETCPIDKQIYLATTEEDRQKLINPMDSKIVAIGMKKNGNEPIIIAHPDEKQMLTEFWAFLSEFKKSSSSNRIVGFNVKDFDLPFVVTRSFIHGVKIVPFTLKDVIDLRENISAFRYGPTRGKMKEFARLLDIEVFDDIDGSKVAEFFWNGQIEKICQYLKKDVEIIEAMNKRMETLRISEIQRW